MKNQSGEIKILVTEAENHFKKKVQGAKVIDRVRFLRSLAKDISQHVPGEDMVLGNAWVRLSKETLRYTSVGQCRFPTSAPPHVFVERVTGQGESKALLRKYAPQPVCGAALIYTRDHYLGRGGYFRNSSWYYCDRVKKENITHVLEYLVVSDDERIIQFAPMSLFIVAMSRDPGMFEECIRDWDELKIERMMQDAQDIASTTIIVVDG